MMRKVEAGTLGKMEIQMRMTKTEREIETETEISHLSDYCDNQVEVGVDSHETATWKTNC